MAHRLENGAVVSGTIDLLIETSEEVAIVDHKTTLTHAGALRKAETFGAQLGCYADAARQLATGKTLSTWVHLPLAGLMVDVAIG